MRRLPIYFLVDISESMVGTPIEQVQEGMRTIIQNLRVDPYDCRFPLWGSERSEHGPSFFSLEEGWIVFLSRVPVDPFDAEILESSARLRSRSSLRLFFWRNSFLA